MPHLTGIRNATGIAKWGDGALAVYPEKGYQKGGPGDGEIKVTPAQLQSAEGELKSDNIKAGTAIFGVPGKSAVVDTADAVLDPHMLVAGYSGYDDGVKKAGQMPNRSAENNHMPGLESTVWPGDRFFIRPPHGYFNGSTWVTAAVPGLTANNLRKGVNVAGLLGELVEGKPFASGSTTVQGPGRFTLDGGGNQDTAYIDVSGLAFVPKTIVVYYYLEVSTVYVAQTRTSGVIKNVWNVSYGNWFAQQFTGTSFSIPVSTKNTADVGRTIYWEAYG